MSYDLMVFNPNKAPRSESEFRTWYENQTEWEEDHDYDDPNVSSEELRNWFLEMIKDFPALNGPYASEDVDVPRLTDYSVGIDIIYAAFPWSESERAFSRMRELAEKHQVGFFEVSGSEDILFPDENGKLQKASGAKAWWKFW